MLPEVYGRANPAEGEVNWVLERLGLFVAPWIDAILEVEKRCGFEKAFGKAFEYSGGLAGSLAAIIAAIESSCRRF